MMVYTEGSSSARLRNALKSISWPLERGLRSEPHRVDRQIQLHPNPPKVAAGLARMIREGSEF